MRLLNTGDFTIKEFPYDHIPEYAILSHTWGDDEYTFQDAKEGGGRNKEGFEKVKRCCSRAKDDGFTYVWIDTCCIDKTSSAELSEAINSMYLWYYQAKRCYAYLADVPPKSTVENSRWFTRGWTLQELLAPSEIHFLDEEWSYLGTKESLQEVVSRRTRIPLDILSGNDDIETASIAQRMSWAWDRQTTRIEDRAYCLMGIFGINMPLLYGEGQRAFLRLQEEIMKIWDDHSLFAWKSLDIRGGLLATSPAAFECSNNIVEFHPFDTSNSPLTTIAISYQTDVCPNRAHDTYAEIAGPDVEADLKDKDGQTALSYAVKGNHEAVVKMLLARNDVETNMKDKDGWTLLWWAVKNRYNTVVKLLLEKGADLESKDVDGPTPLGWAAENGHDTVVKLLLEKGADLESKDIYGQTPLGLAARGGARCRAQAAAQF
ncbi:HET domain-containing protein [Fusarium keratoplasticum]|nr:HET domain-containing protein [Fusarium keratoplasticum]